MERYAKSFLETLNIVNFLPLTFDSCHWVIDLMPLTPTGFCMKFAMLIVIFMWKIKGLIMSKIFLKRNKEISSLYIKTYYEAIVIKAVV